MSESENGTNSQVPDETGEPKLVPVGESIKYRRRAQQAEGRIQQVEQQLKEVQTQLEHRIEDLGLTEAQRDEAAASLLAAENTIATERLLNQAGVTDLEAASLLLSKRLDLGEDLDGEKLTRAVEQLLLDKPYLVSGAGASLPPASASARPARPGGLAQLTRAADRAIRSGNRRDVAEYLRLRRQGASAARRSGDK